MGFDEATIERFWSKVDKRDTNECWEWLGFKFKGGYGCFKPHYKKSISAHRFSLILKTGTDGSGLNGMHLCDNPSCCNPHHLSLGSHSENMKDMISKQRHGKHGPRVRTLLGDEYEEVVKRLFELGLSAKKISYALNISNNSVKLRK